MKAQTYPKAKPEPATQETEETGFQVLGAPAEPSTAFPGNGFEVHGGVLALVVAAAEAAAGAAVVVVAAAVVVVAAIAAEAVN